ncbi:MAG: competence/damage-inducible protein A [Alphaproteobacteria bacterium]|nr:competence/damage-inducible protein A [Alphaproteobacteria bacterium]
MNAPEAPTAAVLIIGNEILSGRTQDLNLNYIARGLTKCGIRLLETRVVPDVTEAIVEAVNTLRANHTYLFTTGGIGATHDDITMASVSAAFGVKLTEQPEARKRIEKHYAERITPARLRMALMPEGAELIDNPISGAPSCRVGNVFVLAGIPGIMQSMFDSIVVGLRHGPAIKSMTIHSLVAESTIADEMTEIVLRHPAVEIGSYPWFKGGSFGTALVARGTDEGAIKLAAEELLALVRKQDTEATLAAG